jgi:repressor LexA
MERPISQRQHAIIEFIRRHIDERGYPPTVREIGEAVKLSSSSTVHALKSLEERGLIQRDAVLTRAIKLTEEPNHAHQTFITQQSRVRSFPIVGAVAAGKPILAVEDIEESFELPENFVSGDCFMLRIKGDSMIEDGIFTDDLIVVRRQKTAENGETVVAMIEGEATCKRFYKEKGRIRLQPANSSMEPIYAESPEILGKVVGLVRKLG